MSGCDTTSLFLGKGKHIVVKFYNKNNKLDEMVATFNSSNVTQEEIDCAGEKFIPALYKAPKVVQSLDELRFVIFNRSVGTAKKSVNLLILIPTSGAARQHSRRVYLEIQEWHGRRINPESWGRKKKNQILVPIYMTQTPAPVEILSLHLQKCMLESMQVFKNWSSMLINVQTPH